MNCFFLAEHSGYHGIQPFKGTVVFINIFGVVDCFINVKPFIQFAFQCGYSSCDLAGIFRRFRFTSNITAHVSQRKIQKIFIHSVSNGKRIRVIIRCIAILRILLIYFIILIIDCAVRYDIFQTEQRIINRRSSKVF